MPTQELEWYPFETGHPKFEGEEAYEDDILVARVVPEDGNAVLTTYVDGRYGTYAGVHENVEAAKRWVERHYGGGDASQS